MDPILGGSLISAGGAAFGGLLGAFSTNSNNKRIARENQKNRDFAHNEAVLAHNRQLEIMDKTNEWNSFANQRSLAEAAGFNPNRIFDSGSSGIATSSGASGGAQASQPSSGYSDPLVNAQMMGLMSDIRLKDSQAKLNEAEAGKVSGEAENVGIKNSFDRITLGLHEKYGEASYILGMDKTHAEIAEADSRRLLNHIEYQLKQSNLYTLRPLEAAKLSADITVANTTSALQRIQAAKTWQDKNIAIGQFVLECKLAEATIYHTYMQGKLASEQSKRESYANELWNPRNGTLFSAAHEEGLARIRAAQHSEFDSSRMLYTKMRFSNIFEDTLFENIRSDNFLARAVRKRWRDLSREWDVPLNRLYLPDPVTGNSHLGTVSKMASGAISGAAMLLP